MQYEWYLYKKRRHGGESHVEMQAWKMELHYHNPQVVCNHWKLEVSGKDSSPETSEGVATGRHLDFRILNSRL